jgi:ATP-dependent Clp protease, protease subunit
MPPPTPPLSKDRDQVAYAVFCGVIDQQSTARIFQALAVATVPQSNLKEIHVLFQSSGGIVSDGICIYNFLRAMTVDVHLYNVGAVQSIAAIAYLGAHKRKTSARATFMLHRVTAGTQFAKAPGLKSITDSVLLDDARTEAILRSHCKLSEEQWAILSHHDLIFSGEEAVRMGFADEIAEFAPPPRTQIFTV